MNKYLQELKKSSKEEFDAKDSGKTAVKIQVRIGDDEDLGESEIVRFGSKKMANDFVKNVNGYDDTFAEILE